MVVLHVQGLIWVALQNVASLHTAHTPLRHRPVSQSPGPVQPMPALHVFPTVARYASGHIPPRHFPPFSQSDELWHRVIPARQMKGAVSPALFPEQQRAVAFAVNPLDTQDGGMWQISFASRTISAGQPQAPS